MKKEREITINVINNNNMNYKKLANFFARKHSEKNIKKE
jgi:hypothetical protein